MNEKYLDKIILGDCMDYFSNLADNSIDLFLSDIPYGICLDFIFYDIIRNSVTNLIRLC